MDKKSRSIAGLTIVLLILIMSTSGCLDYFNFDLGGGTTYESHPTKVRYIISYGYKVNCSGTAMDSSLIQKNQGKRPAQRLLFDR